MSIVERARQIAQEAHSGQFDRMGRPYFEHCERVAAAVSSQPEKLVAYLHDVVEKGQGWSEGRLAEEGFPPDVIAAIDMLTRRKSQPYDDLLRRAKRNRLAASVKIADLVDNLSQAKATGAPTEKYEKGLDYMTGAEPDCP